MSKPILSVRGLVKIYDGGRIRADRDADVRAVDQVDFDLMREETLAIVGESGSGKSSIANAVLQLDPPTNGSVIFDDVDLTRLRPRDLVAVRRKLQVVFQDPYASLNNRMTIGAIVGEPLRIHEPALTSRQRKDRIEKMLAQVGLSDLGLGRYPHQLSGGQRQRIGIARALIVRPKVVVCDEAVSALDVSVQAQVLNLLDDLKREFGLSYLFITHDLAVVRQVADRVLVLNKGRIVEEGSVDNVLERPQDPYTRRLIAAVPGQRAEAERLKARAAG